jgi:hypothetical protein
LIAGAQNKMSGGAMQQPARGCGAASALKFFQRLDAIKHVRACGMTRNSGGRLLERACERITLGEQGRRQGGTLRITKMLPLDKKTR